MTLRNTIPLLVAMSMLTGCATVIEPGQRGVKVSLGQMDRTLLGSGVQVYMPAVEQIIPYSVKQETVSGQAEPLTSDQQPISINYTVLYRIPEGQILTLYEKYAGNPYDRLVAPQIQEAFRQVVSQYKAEGATSHVNVIKDQVLAMVRDNVKGLVDVVDAPITHVSLPEVLQQAIAQKQVMEQQALQKSYELDKARKEAQITVTTAQAQAESIKLQSQALQASPQLIEYERVKKWNGVLPDTMVSGSGSSSFGFMIPPRSAATPSK